MQVKLLHRYPNSPKKGAICTYDKDLKRFVAPDGQEIYPTDIINYPELWEFQEPSTKLVWTECKSDLPEITNMHMMVFVVGSAKGLQIVSNVDPSIHDTLAYAVIEKPLI